MAKPTLAIIVAMSENRVIGRGGGLPWRLPADLQHFKAVTMGHPIVMGRKTFDSIGRALPGRRNIVLTRQRDWTPPAGVEVAHGLEEALARAADARQVFVIGGEAIYKLALPIADRLHVTRVHTQTEGDAFFPPFDEAQWTLAEEQHRPADERHAHAMTFQRYERRGSA